MDHLDVETYPEIQVILGAHTHHFFEEGKWVNQTRLTGGLTWRLYWRTSFEDRRQSLDSSFDK